jgi:predicted dehydrogenase
MAEQVRVGVIGTSWWTEAVLLPMFASAERAKTAAICGRNRERASEVAAKHGIAQVFTDYRQMIDHGGLDALVVASPDDTHHEIVMAALNAGLHIFCEKPVALNAAHAKAMYERAEAAGVKHMVMYSHHWQPMMQRLKQLTDEGYIGQAQVGYFQWLTGWARSSAYQWRYDGNRANGILGDLGSHLIHYAQWVVGDVASVSAQLGFYFQRNDQDGNPVKPANDSALLSLEFTHGAQVQIELSAATHSVGQLAPSFTLSGTRGSISVDWNIGIPVFTTSLRAGQDGNDESLSEAAEFDFIELFRSQPIGPRLFVDSILDDKPIYPGLYEGYKVQQVIDAALESHRTGGRVSIVP